MADYIYTMEIRLTPDQQKGITLEMAHEATKISLDALKAIEQGYSVHKLQSFYYRGFIKIYAKYLELDETKVLQEYNMQESSAPKPQPVQAKESKLPQPIEPSRNFAKDVLNPFLKKNLTAERLGQIGRLFVILFALFLVFKMAGCVVSKIKSSGSHKRSTIVKFEKKTAVAVAEKTVVKEKPKSKSASATKEAQRAAAEKEMAALNETVAQEKPAEVKSTPKNEPAKSEAKADKNSKQIELTVRATKSGWLQVKSDGQVVFQSTLKKGDAETWKAEKEIELSGKNINLLEFELNGKMLGALGASDRGAKKVVFTKDGLSVKK